MKTGGPQGPPGFHYTGGMRAIPVVLVLVLLAGAKPDAEAKLRDKAALVFVDFAQWLKEKGQKGEAERALAVARELGAPVEPLAAEIEALEQAEADPDLDARRKRAHAEGAKLFEQLAKAVDDEAKADGYLLRAAELEPGKARLGKLAARAKQYAGNKAKADAAGRILARLREIDPKGDYDAIERDLALDDVAVVKAPGHPMVGYVSLPKGWKRKGEWPVLVTVDGAGSNFLGAARGARDSRGSRPWIVLAPCSLSNTNELLPAQYPFYDAATLEAGNRDRIGFDVEGLLGLLAVLRERYGAAEQIGITGFSGGGNLTYAMTALHPARVRFAVPACANFSGLGFRDAKPVEGGGPPVFIVTGEKDPHREFTHGNKEMPGIEPQTDAGVKALEALGFTRVRRTMLPGVGHSSCLGEVWKAADEVAGR